MHLKCIAVPQGWIDGGDLGDILTGVDYLRESGRLKCGDKVHRVLRDRGELKVGPHLRATSILCLRKSYNSQS